MSSDTFDVVIVGSGGSGGTLAAHLARLGVRVAVVEGGPRVNRRTDFNTHALPFDFPTRQIPTMRPGKPGFDSERSRGVGGKTMPWNAVALRFSQRDFKGCTYEGAAADTTYIADYAYLLREPGGAMRVVHDRLVEGLFPRADWVAWLAGAGFDASVVPFEQSELEPGSHEVFVARKPAR